MLRMFSIFWMFHLYQWSEISMMSKTNYPFGWFKIRKFIWRHFVDACIEIKEASPISNESINTATVIDTRNATAQPIWHFTIKYRLTDKLKTKHKYWITMHEILYPQTNRKFYILSKSTRHTSVLHSSKPMIVIPKISSAKFSL